MKAMILAAGVGERMRPLTDRTPKPLLRVGGVPLLEHHIRRLALAGYSQLVINVSHLAQQIIDYCGDGARWGLSIVYSHEQEPLETAGGIFNAMPLLGEQPFLVVNGDIWIDCDFGKLRQCLLEPPATAHLVMVANPPQHPRGDFGLDNTGWLRELGPGDTGLTYAGVGIYSADFFADMRPGKKPLRPLLDAAIRASCLSGEYHPGQWQDVGTPDRLKLLDEAVRSARVSPAVSR